MHGELEVWTLVRDVGLPDGNEDSEDGVEEPGDCANSDDNSDGSCAGNDGGWGLIFDQGENGFEGSDGTFIGCVGIFVDHEPG